MKHLLITLFILSNIIIVNAQIQKGTILVEGSLGYNRFSNSNEFVSNGNVVEAESISEFLLLRPQIGFFSSESTLLGIGINYEHRTREQQNPSSTNNFDFSSSSNIILINPYFTKFTKLTDNFYFTTRINLLAGVGKLESNGSSETESDIFDIRLNITPGLTYFVSNKWALTGSIGQLFYSRRQETLEVDSPDVDELKNVNSNFGLSAGLNTFSIGFQYYLNNSKGD